MVERICPQCQRGNPLENRFCGSCGSPLERNQLASQQETSLTIAGRKLPAQQLRQVGQALAVSLAALAAEAGMAWLRRKVEQINLPPPPTQQRSTAVQTAPTKVIPATPPQNIITIVSQRVVETWEQGVLTRQVVERQVWRREG